jgi:pyruvate kinase
MPTWSASRSCKAPTTAHLQDEPAKRRPDRREIGIIAKIETAQALRNLPEIIVRAAGKQPFSVMIARGDLAVAIGIERLAEEEILWLCEAAHVPVIWGNAGAGRNGESRDCRPAMK